MLTIWDCIYEALNIEIFNEANEVLVRNTSNRSLTNLTDLLLYQQMHT